MPDNLSPEDRRRTMRAVKSRGTAPERRLFAMLAGMRLRGWRRNADDLPGKPDVAFPAYRVAIFADGCFWHGCPDCARTLPETHHDYWTRKIQRNVDRDRRNSKQLQAVGWKVVRIWEHQFRDQIGRELARRNIREAVDRDNEHSR